MENGDAGTAEEAAADQNGQFSAAAQALAEAAQASPPEQDAHAAAAGSDCDSDVVIVEGDENGETACSSHSGFYRAARETGRANILLALQVFYTRYSSHV